MSNDSQQDTMIMEPTILTYKKHPVLALPIGNGFSLRVGLKKCKAIITHKSVIQAFVDTGGKSLNRPKK